MKRTSEMENFLDKLAQDSFGRERKSDQCVSCGSKKVESDDFRDDLSRKEFGISNFCQVCQDSVFETD